MAPTIQFKRGSAAAGVGTIPALRAGEPGFSTNFYDLFIGFDTSVEGNKFFGSHRYWAREDGTESLRLRLVAPDGDVNKSIQLQAPKTHTGITTYTFPSTASDGYFLKTNATGELEWASVTADASFDNVTLNDAIFTGISSFSGPITASDGLYVSAGISTFANVDINDGEIDGTVIGGSNAAAGTFTELAYNNSSTSGISTVGSLYVDTTEVLSTEGGLVTLSGIATLDATTKATLESLLSLDPNDFDTLNVSGISTIGGLLEADGGLDVFGHTELDDLNVTGFATFTNAINADLLGNAGTATSLSTPRDFDITGDFITSAAVSFDGTGNVSLAATITANSIELGTYTSGNYVATVAGTDNQISVSGSGSATAAVTISLPDDVVVGTSLSVSTLKTATIEHSNGTEAITIDAGGNVGVSTNLTITGDLIVNGSTTTIETETLLVKDSLIEVGLVDNGSGALIAPSSDANIDVGMLFHYYSGTAKKAAVYWDDSTSRITFADDVSETNSVLTATTYATILAGGLEINNACTGGTDEVISCVNGELALNNIVVDGGVF